MNFRTGFRILMPLIWGGLIFLYAGFPAAQAATNSGITYHGRILKPDGTPLEGAIVQFKLQIRTPDASSCLMYEEQQTKDMRNSNGVFTITINDGTGNRTDTSGYTIDQVFANRGSYTFDISTCNAGPGTYIPNANDGRKFQVYFRDETMSSWEPMPLANINFVPMAIEAKQVGGFGAQNLLRVDDAAAAQNATPFTLQELTDLKSLIAGTSSLYMKSTTGGGATLPVFSGNPSSPAQGSIWFDSVSGELKYHDGTTVKTVGSGGGGGGSGTVTSITAGPGLTGGTITTTGTIALEDHGTPGTYFKVTTDAKGRVTSGSTTLDAADIPSLDWSKISTGKPTTVDGYGITDAVKNAGGIVSLQAGNDADKPAAGTAGRIYVATDTQKIYRDDGTIWIVVASVDAGGGGGGVSEVTVSGAPLSVINGTTTPQISITQAGASSSGYLSQTDWNTFNSKLDSSLNAGQIYIGDSSNVATARTPSGDVSMNENGAFTVQKIQGSSVSNTTPVDGQVLKYVSGGTNAWTPSNFSIGDLKTSGGVQQFANAICTSSQTLTWNSLTDTFTCSNISGLNASVITAGTFDIARIPTGTSGSTVAVGNDSRFPSGACGAGKKMRWDGSAWQCEDDNATDATKVAKAGDTMTGTLHLPANGLVVGTNQLVVAGGNIGIGTANPQSPLQVNGYIQLASSLGVPAAGDCDDASEYGRVIANVESGAGHLYLCTQDGWKTFSSGSGGGTGPDPFVFTDQSNIAVNETVYSDIVQITGHTGANISVAGDGSPAFRVCYDFDCSNPVTGWISGSASIQNYQFVQLKMASASTTSTERVATLTVGAQTAEWHVTTSSCDSTPVQYTTPGQYTYTVPSGCANVKIEAYGAGGGGNDGGEGGAGGGGGSVVTRADNTLLVAGGGGGGGTGEDGANFGGGGGGYARSTVAVTSGEQLILRVGGGGSKNGGNNGGSGGAVGGAIGGSGNGASSTYGGGAGGGDGRSGGGSVYGGGGGTGDNVGTFGGNSTYGGRGAGASGPAGGGKGYGDVVINGSPGSSSWAGGAAANGGPGNGGNMSNGGNGKIVITPLP